MLLAVLSLAAPVVAILLALRWTRRIESDDPLPVPVKRVKGLDRAGVLGSVLGVAALVLLVLRAKTAFLLVAVPAWMFLLTSTVRVLSRERVAGRPVVAWDVTYWIVVPCLLAVAYGSTGVVEQPRPWWLLHAAVVLSLGVALWAHVRGHVAGQDRAAEGIRLVMALALLVLTVAGWARVRPRDRDDVFDWVRTFDATTEDHAAWAAFGRAARWLRQEGLALPEDIPAAHRVREAVTSDCDIDGAVFVAAFDAGLLRDVDLGACRADVPPTFPMTLGGNGFLPASEDPRARLRMALAAGAIDGEARTRLADEVLAQWPDPGRDSGLERAYECLVDLELLGQEERIEARRDACHALLEAHVCRRPYSFARGGGFSAYRPDGDGCRSDAIATWQALELARYVGIPDGVDLQGLDAYVRGTDEGWWLPGDSWNPLHGRTRDQALLRARFGNALSADLPLSSLLLAWRVPFSLLCLAALGVLLVLRSPAVRTVPNPETRSRWPRHMVDAFPELRREEFLRRQQR